MGGRVKELKEKKINTKRSSTVDFSSVYCAAVEIEAPIIIGTAQKVCIILSAFNIIFRCNILLYNKGQANMKCVETNFKNYDTCLVTILEELSRRGLSPAGTTTMVWS